MWNIFSRQIEIHRLGRFTNFPSLSDESYGRLLSFVDKVNFLL